MPSNDLKAKLWAAERSSPDDLRAAGLTVAVHNDYKLDGERYTFWLMTYQIPNPAFRSGFDTIAFRGEGKTDEEGYRCAYSGRELTPETATVDHITPVCRSGPNTLGNLAIVHADVNAAKASMTLPEFIAVCRDVVAWSDRRKADDA